MPTSAAGFSIDPTGRHRIDFAGRPRILTIAFALLWLSGWLLMLTLTFLDYLRWGTPGLGLLVLATGPPVALALLWVACGKRESLLVTPGEITIVRWAGPIRLSRKLEPSAIRSLRVDPAPAGLLFDLISDPMALRQFYSGGSGRIVFDTDRGTFSVGHTVSNEEAARVVERIRQLVPQLSGPAAEPEDRRRGMKSSLASTMMMTMLAFALVLPFKLAVSDRPICFYNDAVAPRRPIDVSGARPPGRVYLVPIDDFPADRVRSIAEHYRTKFGVAIEVAPAIAWPDDAYVPERHQMNSAVMLARLEEMFGTADGPVIAIGLTTRDMFNPGVHWSYVFSYRDDRMAVVSPARMDRGCMGVFPADEGRIDARLRKMVGKNIGILYFGLDLSLDPASMLYENIRGPQELDAMSELF